MTARAGSVIGDYLQALKNANEKLQELRGKLDRVAGEAGYLTGSIDQLMNDVLSAGERSTERFRALPANAQNLLQGRSIDPLDGLWKSTFDENVYRIAVAGTTITIVLAASEEGGPPNPDAGAPIFVGTRTGSIVRGKARYSLTDEAIEACPNLASPRFRWTSVALDLSDDGNSLEGTVYGNGLDENCELTPLSDPIVYGFKRSGQDGAQRAN